MARYLSALVLSLNILFAQLFIVSVQIDVKNTQLLRTSLMASPAMSAVDIDKVYAKTNIFLTKTCKHTHFFECYKDKIITYLLAQEVIVKSYDKTINLNNLNYTQLTVPPVYMQVEFNDTLAKIALIKQKE